MDQLIYYTLVFIMINPGSPEFATLQNVDVMRIPGLTYQQCMEKSNELYETKVAQKQQFLMFCEENGIQQ